MCIGKTFLSSIISSAIDHPEYFTGLRACRPQTTQRWCSYRCCISIRVRPDAHFCLIDSWFQLLSRCSCPLCKTFPCFEWSCRCWRCMWRQLGSWTPWNRTNRCYLWYCSLPSWAGCRSQYYEYTPNPSCRIRNSSQRWEFFCLGSTQAIQYWARFPYTQSYGEAAYPHRTPISISKYWCNL